MAKQKKMEIVDYMYEHGKVIYMAYGNRYSVGHTVILQAHLAEMFNKNYRAGSPQGENSEGVRRTVGLRQPHPNSSRESDSRHKK